MRMVKLLWAWSGLLAFVVLICVFNSTGAPVIQGEKENVRSDAIIIKTMTQFGELLQRPPVLFLHDQHTTALSKQDKDCAACHMKEKDRYSLKFKRSGDMDRQTLMDIYHGNCIGCHQEMNNENEVAGPVTCGECHQKDPGIVAQQDPMEFDKSLHYRHQNASQNKCETCHHEYDAATQKIFYAKGKEGSCRYCHMEEDGKTGMRFQTAAHLDCIACHQDKIRAGNDAGPIRCEGCHDPAIKKEIKTVDPVPRVDRNQPDYLIVKRFDPDIKIAADNYRMKQVPFNHILHEESQQTCRICHHSALTSCNECHTLAGSKKGDFNKLEKAMHQQGADMSCAGCHGHLTRDEHCNGCHHFMVKDKKDNEDYCGICHFAKPNHEQESANRVMTPEKIKALLAAQSQNRVEMNPEKIPDEVKINFLENKYGPVKLPHRKIIQALAANIKENRLAEAFHNGTQKLCRGCHHNSPLTETPPRCSSCHGKPFDAENALVPGLMGAYHQQCMGCHKQMKLEKPISTDCTACHEEKQNP